MSEEKTLQQKRKEVLVLWESVKHANPSFMTQDKKGKNIEINVAELVDAIQSTK